jgi:very-short-patch-repair endonuclease/predicted transcriptional regulator of viral defense system
MPDDRHCLPAEQTQTVGHPDRALGELAARQHGVVARRQLAAIGVTRQMVASRVAGGQLVRVHRGVYAVGHARLRREGWWMAAVLAAGPGALLSHRDAAALHGLRPPGDRGRVEVTTTGRAASTPRIDVHATTVLDARDAASVADIPTTGIARTLVDLAAVASPRELRKALEEAERQRRLDATGIEEVLGRTRGRRGAGHAAMREALARLGAVGARVTKSELEDRFVALFDAHDLPRPATNASVQGMEVDACWPQQRVVVELDGWADHGTRDAFQRDRERGNALELAGWRLLRFTWADVARHPQETAATVRGALARGRRYPPSP